MWTDATSSDGRLWTIHIGHARCPCQWCADVESDFVMHVYERRDDDVYVYRRSHPAEEVD